VRPTAQCSELPGGGGTVEWFAEAFAAARQGLVRAEDEPSRKQSRNRSGLCARKVPRNRGRIGKPRLGLLGALIDLGRPDLNAKAGSGKNLAAHLASRCEH
jgi:hypothetical protein